MADARRASGASFSRELPSAHGGQGGGGAFPHGGDSKYLGGDTPGTQERLVLLHEQHAGASGGARSRPADRPVEEGGAVLPKTRAMDLFLLPPGGGGSRGPTVNPTPYTLHPKPSTLHLAPYTLHPTPYTLNPKP